MSRGDNYQANKRSTDNCSNKSSFHMEERYTLMQICKDFSCSTQRVDNYTKIREQRELLEERLYRGEQEFFIAQDEPLPLIEHIPEHVWESTFLARNRFLLAIGIPVCIVVGLL